MMSLQFCRSYAEEDIREDFESKSFHQEGDQAAG